jgi:hypothetical protein
MTNSEYFKLVGISAAFYAVIYLTMGLMETSQCN